MTRDRSSDHADLIATVFNYSLDGLLADEGTEFCKFCFDLPENREPDDPAQLDFLHSAYAHIMGRTAYEGIAGAMTTSTDHPFADILNSGRKVVFSRTAPDGTPDDHSAPLAGSADRHEDHTGRSPRLHGKIVQRATV